MKKIISYRRYVQLFFAIAIYAALTYFHISLGILFLITLLLGAVLGKTFCKWMCPMGFIMEMMTRSMTPEQKQNHMYNYYKVGCPISWAQGLLNKVSLFKIKVNSSTCTTCGQCDKACYIATLDITKSVYDSEKKKATTAFNCSKCMACVAACPNNSIKYKI